MSRRNETESLFLAHPLYLDNPMMVSFLATLDNGVAYSSEVAERLASSKEGEGEGSGKVGIPSLAQWLGLSLSAEGRYKRRSSNDETVEAKLVREHTSASLFNILRRRLLEASAFKVIGEGGLSGVQPGDLVEIRGPIDVDPLRKLMKLLTTLAPFLGVDLENDSTPPRAKSNRQGGSRAGSAGQAMQTSFMDDGSIRIAKILLADLEKSPLLDLILKTANSENVVLAASAEYMTESAQQYLLAGEFVAMGKVTQLLASNDKVSLLRRTVLSAVEATGEASVTEAFSGLATTMPNLEISELEVSGPGLQVVPLAIYV